MRGVLRLILAGALSLAAVPAAASDGPPPFPEVTFKRIGPPPPGATRRITVRIEPVPPEAAVAAVPAPRPDAPAPSPGPQAGYDWYWAAVSPALADAGPARVGRALAVLSDVPDGAGPARPRLQPLAEIADRHAAEILSATVGTRVSPALVVAMIAVESSGRPSAVSHAGAAGLMQLMPATADRFGVADRHDPAQNIRGGVAYMDWLLGEFGGDAVLALAGYNAGENAVRRHGGVPPFDETRAYVPKVLTAWTVARGLCLTPPQLLTDGCVFVSASSRERG